MGSSFGSIGNGPLSVQTALWWSMEHVYHPIPHMQQVNAQWFIDVKLTYKSGHKYGACNNQTDLVPPYTGKQIRGNTCSRTCRRHPHGQAHRLAFPTGQDMFKMGQPDALIITNHYDENLKLHLEEWQLRMRACFDYRMLRDWGYGRHWKMFVVVDDTKISP
jgi:hypothetical protein